MSTLADRSSTNARVAGSSPVILRRPQTAEESRLLFIQTPARNKWLSLAAAVALHAIVLFVGGAALYQPAQFGVQSGIGSVDVDLVVAAPVEQTPVEAPVLPETEFADAQAPAAPVVEQVIKPQAPSAASAGNDGAVWNEPQYLSNRPPKYPHAALMGNIEGTTLLVADIDEKGRPAEVRIEKSSGDASLDASALRAVRQWSFNPARVAGVSVRSRSRIPITFRIDSKKRI